MTNGGKTKSMKPQLWPGEDLLDQAQDIIYDAWEVRDARKRVALAKRALAISPDCADAYVLLAQASRKGALELYRKGVEAGERALGKEIFETEAGNFWGVLETRPYMRARVGLAQSLWDCGQHDLAIAHWRDMLRLNSNDNLGIRYVLAARLLERGLDRELAALLKEYEEDGGAYLIWTKALLAFRTSGDGNRSRRALRAALESNPHIPAYLLGRKAIPRQLPEYVGFGDEREAVCWAAENMNAWKATTGALAWLCATIDAEESAILN